RAWGGRRGSAGALLLPGGHWLFSALLTPAVFALSRRWPLARPHLVRNALLHLTISLLFCAAWAGAGTVLKAALMPRAVQSGVAISFVSWLFITFPFGVAVYLAIFGIEHAVRYFAQVRERGRPIARHSA